MFSIKNGPFQGIIKDMYNNGKTDQISIHALYNSPYYPTSCIIDFADNTCYWLSEIAEEGQYISFELKDRWVSLTHFLIQSLRGAYPLSFDFLASSDGSHWTPLFSQRNSNILDKGYEIYAVNQSIVARFFKIINRGPSALKDENEFKLRISKFDLYGTITPCFTTCSAVPAFLKLSQFCGTCVSLFPHSFTVCYVFWILS